MYMLGHLQTTLICSRSTVAVRRGCATENLEVGIMCSVYMVSWYRAWYCKSWPMTTTSVTLYSENLLTAQPGSQIHLGLALCIAQTRYCICTGPYSDSCLLSHLRMMV
ncbi:hypothetical protein BT63DRAFT_427596 [Microthyrium microscopicum]|uniref:Uncharacterized protein n=1 Tax=Microthyrium microscopicum TaxID=703497 RepID=A0A6A6U4X7_9PEZI|nr:hypothetical protein BT63DRAFT_427596 [Microthyrium microscopicum]